MLHSIGVISDHLRRRLVQEGILLPVTTRVYLFGPTGHKPTPSALASAGSLVAGPGGAVSHTTAAMIDGTWDRSVPSRVHITAPRRIHVPRGGRFISHEIDEPFSPEEVVYREGACIPSNAMTFLMLATMMTPYELAYILKRSSDLRLIDRSAILQLLEDRRWHRGVAVARAALALHDSGCAGSRGRSEDCYLARSARLGLPTPTVNTKGSVGVAGYEPDIVYVQWQTIVHIDGPGHDRPGVREQDLAEDARMAADGWSIIRRSSREPWRRDDRLGHIVRSVLESRGWNGIDGVPHLDDPMRRPLIAWLSRID